MTLDKSCLKILSVLYESETTEQEIAAMIDWKDLSQPNKYIQYLLGNGLIQQVLRDATPDGEGGYKDNTGTAYYQITVHGKAEFENLCGRRIEKALDLAASLFPL
jgi:hypothetical protein